MHIIDRYAYNNRIRNVEPAHKASLSLMVLLLCLMLNKPLVGLVAAGWMFLLAVGLAGIPARTFGRVLLAETTFLILTTIGVAFSISTRDPGSITDWAWQLGPFWFSSSPDSLYYGLVLVTRALGCASAMNFLALTTPLVDLVDLFRRWRVPPLLIDLMTVIYRFIFVLLESLDRMYMAQDSRLGYHSYRRGMISAGLLGSRLFIDAYQRSQRLQIALESRGYTSELRTLPSRYKDDRTVLWVSVAVAVSLLLVWAVGNWVIGNWIIV